MLFRSSRRPATVGSILSTSLKGQASKIKKHALDPGGLGGLAADINALCSDANKYAYADVNYGYNSFPTYSWTVNTITHEFGHLLGSQHTHACVWNTFNLTAIDGCGPTYGANYNPPIIYEGSCSGAPIPTGGGTIMSYCHLGAVGINFNNGFGSQPAARIQNRIENASCLGTSCASPLPPLCSQLPDLVIVAQTVTPLSVTAGNVITVNFAEDNNGTTGAPPNYVNFHLSPDNILTPGLNGDLYLDQFYVNQSIPPLSSSLAYNKQILIRSNTATGTYYIFFAADGTGIVNECDNTNNFATTIINVTAASCISPAISTEPSNKSVTAPNGTSFAISASGSNNSYQWQSNTGSGWSNFTNNSTYSGALTTTLTIISTTVSMSGYQYRCKVSSSCTTATVTSNAATLTVSTSSTTCNNDNACTPKTLPISSSCFSTSCSTVGATAPNPAIVYTSCSGTPYQNGRYDDDVWFSITPSSSNPVTIKVTPTSNLSNFDPVLGVYTGSCVTPTQTGCADVNSNGGAEQLIFTPIANTTYLIRVFGYGIGSAYSGNFDICVTAPGQSNPLPDLLITNASFSINSLCAGGNLDVSYGVTNNGSASANSSTVKYYLSSDNNYSANDVLLGTTTIGSISSNATISHIRNLVIPQTTGVGGWYILIIADANNDVAEGTNGEANNVFSNTIQIANCSGSADLAIHYNNYNPATVTPGTTVHVNYTYGNSGSIIAGHIHIGIYLSQDNTFDASTDEYVGNWFKGSLDPGQTATEFLNFTLPSCHQCGSYYVFLVIDYDNIVAESNENNNYDYFPIEITGCVTCNVSIPSTGLNFQSAGGTGNINVTTTQCCPWIATTNDNWITITNSSGTGNGTVNYSVSPCNSGGTKTGTLNVNGQPHQITQNCTELCNASQSFEWAAQAGSPTYSEYAYDLVVDATGNIYMTGSIQGSSSFGNGITLTTPSSAPDVFVSKHNALGQIQWAVNFGNTGQDQGTGIAKDNSGNIFVVGSFNNIITFGSTTLTSNGANNDAIFIVKLDPSNGSVIWANKINPTGSGFGVKIVIDNNDNIYLSGGGWFPFVAKYNTSGTQTLYHSYGYLTFNLSGIGYDNSSNIIISGNFSGTMTLGPITLTSISAYDGFVAKLDGNGNAIWAQQLSSSSTAQNTFNSVVVDAANNIYAIGNVNGTAIVGNITIPLSPGSKAIIIKFDQNGNPTWGKASIEGTQYPKKIVKGNDNNLYFSGYFGTSMKMDTTTIISSGSNDGFIVSMDDNGKVIWLKGFGSAQADEAYTIGLNNNSDVFVAGGFSGSVVYGNTTITSSGSIDIFLTKFKQCVPPNANVTYTGNLVLCPGQTMNLSTSYCSSNIYQWVLNNSEIGNANNPTYIATEPGSYKVKVSSFIGCETITDPVTISSSGVYTFIGNGNWDNPTNWNNNTIPPDVLPSCYEIIVDPQIGGECILNTPQTISPGAKITVQSGKVFRLLGNLTIQN